MGYTHEQMRAVFTPKTVAVVGAPRSFKPGLVFLQALLDPGFKGDVFAVNPNADQILGLKAYPSVEAVPAQIDLAIAIVVDGDTVGLSVPIWDLPCAPPPAMILHCQAIVPPYREEFGL